MTVPAVHDCPFCKGRGCPHCGGGEVDDRELCQAPTAPGLYPNLRESIYHGDPNSLSSTGVRLLVKDGGPAKFHGAVREDNDDFDIGTAAHTLLLGTGADITIVDAATWQGKAAKIARARARAEGKVPLLRKQYNATRAMVDAALTRPEVADLFPGGPDSAAELSAYAMDPATWVMLRARFDYIVFQPDRHVLVRDYKTTKDASPRAFKKSATDYGYHVQAAHYWRVLEELGYVVDEFILLAQEKVPPYLTCLHEFDAEAIEVGDRVVSAAIEIFNKCRAADDWPGYDDRIHRMSLPAWAIGEW